MQETASLENKKLIEMTEEVILALRQNREDVLNQVNRLMKPLLCRLSELVQCLEQQENAEEVNQIILARLQNLNMAYSRMDIVLLADVLQYEIVELLHFSMEIAEGGK